MADQETTTIDITPTPRILQIIGEVDLPPRRCFAEFIDNALDEGIDGTPGRTPEDSGGEPLEIKIQTPSIHEFDDDYENATISIWDSGPGMSPDELENNLKAGYSGKDPMGNMGLFGVGFNIATARLGNRTVVRTTQAGDDYWAVATIDLQSLVSEGSYNVEVQFEEKIDSSEHGTEITIHKLEDFARTLRRKKKLKSGLSRMYSTVLENNNVDLRFNGEKLEPRPHCIWSDERSVEIGGEEIQAVIDVDEKVGEGYYCKSCWSWWEERYMNTDEAAGPEDLNCPSCDDGGDIVHREQRVWGWVGIQRFLDENHYGIDLIRNGRVIEELDKSLFEWRNPETGEMEKEYPIDSTHYGGRIVGELHIDFVPVTNVKDGFRKGNDRWQKVRKAIRGEASFRPTYAREHGYEPNRTPLGKLFKGYRTANKAGKKRLVPGRVHDDGSVETMNAEPKKWAEKFWEGDPEYQDDSKWWEAVERAEKAKRSSGNPFKDESDDEEESETSGTESDSASSVTGDSGGSSDEESTGAGFDIDPNADTDPSDSTATVEGEGDSPDMGESEGDDGGSVADKGESGFTVRKTQKDQSVSGKYGLQDIDEPDIDVTAIRVTQGDLDGEPVLVESPGLARRDITFDPRHELFTEFGYSPRNVILMEVASTLLSRMDNPEGWTQGRIYSALVEEYCQDERSSPAELAKNATQILRRIKTSIANQGYDVEEDAVSDAVRDKVTRKFLSNDDTSGDLENLFQTTEFLQYAPNSELVRYFREHPDQFFDGNIWEYEYENLPTEQLRREAVDEYIGYLRDAQMLADEGLDMEIEADSGVNPRIDRAAASLRLLDAKTPMPTT